MKKGKSRSKRIGKLKSKIKNLPSSSVLRSEASDCWRLRPRESSGREKKKEWGREKKRESGREKDERRLLM